MVLAKIILSEEDKALTDNVSLILKGRMPMSVLICHMIPTVQI